MIGYSKYAKTRYHKVHRAYIWRSGRRPRRAACDLVRRIDSAYEDDREAELKKAAPHLSRCPKCWPTSSKGVSQ